jgi:hypothetical protein
MRRHDFDPISLIFGVLFAVTGAVFLFATVDLNRVPPAWSWPIPLMIVGVLIILLAMRRERPAETPASSGTIAPEEPPRHTDELIEWPPPEEPRIPVDES